MEGQCLKVQNQVSKVRYPRRSPVATGCIKVATMVATMWQLWQLWLRLIEGFNIFSWFSQHIATVAEALLEICQFSQARCCHILSTISTICQRFSPCDRTEEYKSGTLFCFERLSRLGYALSKSCKRYVLLYRQSLSVSTKPDHYVAKPCNYQPNAGQNRPFTLYQVSMQGCFEVRCQESTFFYRRNTPVMTVSKTATHQELTLFLADPLNTRETVMDRKTDFQS